MTEVSQRWRNLVIYLCLALVTAALYWPVGHFEFTNYDDDCYVTDNPHVQGGVTPGGVKWALTSGQFGNWHPLTWLSHMLDCQLFELNAGAHHLISVLFHVANTLLLFTVLNRMTGSPWRSGFVAALFALHPLHVESVAWVAERKDVLSACFWMLTMWAYVRYVEQPNRKRYFMTLALYAMGLMAKPIVVTLPFVLLLLDYWPLGRTQWLTPVIGDKAKAPFSRLVTEKFPFFLLAVLSCAITFCLQYKGGEVLSFEKLPMDMRVPNAVVSYARYLGKAFWPSGLAVFYPYRKWPGETVIDAGAVLVGMSGWAIWRARRAPHFVVGWLWYLGTLVPVIGLVQVGTQSMADRYTYLSLIGLFIMLAWTVPRSVVEGRVRKMVAVAFAAALLIGCAVLLSWSQIQHWKTSKELFRHALQVTESNWLAHHNLGLALAQEGKVTDAIGHYEQALQINPTFAETHNNLGLALAQEGKVTDAIGHYEQALRIKPDYAEAHNSLGLALLQAGKREDAIGHYEQALRIKPDYAEAHNNLAIALEQTGKREEAIEHYEQAVRLKPNSAAAHYNLGYALFQLGKVEEAVGHLEWWLRSHPDDVETHYTLATLLAKQGRIDDAISHLRSALKLKPGSENFRRTLEDLQRVRARPEAR
jgi:Flp pilus assembly protein TadD